MGGLTDSMHQPRDDNGQWVSISTLFERERLEHSKDHESERIVAKETAQRLEREVEQTALRLERVVEETALRIEKAVQTALTAVSETAKVHAEAHSKEHIAHERIHAVEKIALDKAEIAGALEADRLATALAEYKKTSNEWRAALSDQSGKFVARDYYDARHEELKEKIGTMEKRMAYYAGAAAMGGFALSLILRLLHVGG